MRYKLALILAASLGAAASVYARPAEARVYVGVGLPVPVYAPPVVAAYPGPGYYGPGPYYGTGYFLGGYRGNFGRGFYRYPRLGFGYRHWGHFRR
ncbi:MAG TPA: hypothetical protein VK820_06580 [Steroidobacteraceae bacterium]|jgi:hypothetical protein|nr:hypothetical protein [Steroidobacteraceae bacterium]